MAGFPGGSDGKESSCKAGDRGLIPGLGRSPGNPLQYSCLENSMDRGTWRTVVHGVAKSETQLRDCAHTHTHTHGWSLKEWPWLDLVIWDPLAKKHLGPWTFWNFLYKYTQVEEKGTLAFRAGREKYTTNTLTTRILGAQCIWVSPFHFLLPWPSFQLSFLLSETITTKEAERAIIIVQHGLGYWF